MESEMKFKVGDVVRRIDGEPFFEDIFAVEIVEVHRDGYLVLCRVKTPLGCECWFYPKELELAASVPCGNVVSLDTYRESKALSGGSNDYYKVAIDNPTTPDNPPYLAECNDIIEALGMDFMLGNIFKACWRIAAARKGQGKPGNTEKYDAEKISFFAKRILSKHE